MTEKTRQKQNRTFKTYRSDIVFRQYMKYFNFKKWNPNEKTFSITITNPTLQSLQADHNGNGRNMARRAFMSSRVQWLCTCVIIILGIFLWVLDKTTTWNDQILATLTTLETFESAALSPRLSQPSKPIRHENGAFRKRSSNQGNLKTPALRLSVDGKHFKDRAFRKRWRH